MMSLSLTQSVTSEECQEYECHLDADLSCTLIDNSSSTLSSETSSEDSETSDEEQIDLDFDGDLEDEDLDDLPFLSLFGLITQSDEDILFAEHGYETIERVCATLQGELYKAEIIASPGSFVAIKKIEKDLAAQKIAEDEDGMTVCVEEDILKESVLLKYLTLENIAMGGYIVKYVDFFSSDSHYYLVTEFIDNKQMNLQQFIEIAHQYIQCGQLKLRTYQKICKFIMWQLITTLNNLHNIHQCTHLDLCLENIMLENVNFIKNSDGSMALSNSISIKLCDFGAAEIFDGDFSCYKQGAENNPFLAPKVLNGEQYDARCADMYSLGMIFFKLLTGDSLYTAHDIWCQPQNGYLALINGTLHKYLEKINFLKYFNRNSFNLLTQLLSFNEKERISAMDAVKHEFFKTYFKKYQSKLNKKIQRGINKVSHSNFQLPYYQMF